MKETTETPGSASFLDIYLKFETNGQLSTWLYDKREDFNFVITLIRRVWRYPSGNQNPYIEEKQTTQWPKEKVQKDKQRFTIYLDIPMIPMYGAHISQLMYNSPVVGI